MGEDCDIVFYYGRSEDEWSPDDDKLRVFQRKCIELGKEFIKNGYSVSVYGSFKFNYLEYNGVKFYNLRCWNLRQKVKHFIMMDFLGFIPIGQYQQIFEKINA